MKNTRAQIGAQSKSTAQAHQARPIPGAQTRIRLSYPFPRSTHTRCSMECLLGIPRSQPEHHRQHPDHPWSRSKNLGHTPCTPGVRPNACSAILGNSRTQPGRDQLSPDTCSDTVPDPTPTQRPTRLHSHADPPNPTRPD